MPAVYGFLRTVLSRIMGTVFLNMRSTDASRVPASRSYRGPESPTFPRTIATLGPNAPPLSALAGSSSREAHWRAVMMPRERPGLGA